MIKSIMATKKDNLPYQEKGRWYQLKLSSDGNNITVLSSDIEIELDTNYIKLPIGFHVLDAKYDINSIPHVGTTSLAIDLIGYADGCQGIQKPLAKAFDIAFVYVYGYFV